jgi:hypothetical protein
MRINGAAFFKHSFELKIKGDLIPEAAAEEIIGEFQALFARHNTGAALSAKAKIDSSADSPAGSELDSEGFECEGTVVALFAFDLFFCGDDRDFGKRCMEHRLP